MNLFRHLYDAMNDHFGPASEPEPTEFGETYEAVNREIERVHAIRRKAEGQDAARLAGDGGHYQQRACTLGQHRGGVSL